MLFGTYVLSPPCPSPHPLIRLTRPFPFPFPFPTPPTQQVEFSPFHEGRLAVATAQYFGIIGNGRQYVLERAPDGSLRQCRNFLTQEGLYDCSWSEMNQNQVGRWVGGWVDRWVDGYWWGGLSFRPPTHPPTHTPSSSPPQPTAPSSSGIS